MIMRFDTKSIALSALPILLAASAFAAPSGQAHSGISKNKPAPPKAVAAVPAPPPAPVEFLRDVAPILDRNSCSTAGCHGKFGGRGGFQISLLTLSPEDDYEPIIYGARGRRVNFAEPEKSLLLLKATGQVPHGGGPRFAANSPDYNTLLNWIKQGAHFDDKDPRLVSLAITPAKVTLLRPLPPVVKHPASVTARATGKRGRKPAAVVAAKPAPPVAPPIPTTQLHVWATYTDGSKRDVTKQTVFQSTNTGVLNVDTNGIVAGQRWGGGAILGRYLGTIAASFVTLPQERKGAYPVLAGANVIDTYVLDNLKALNVVPSALSGDAEFQRRVTLDTLGRLPTPEEIAAFSADTKSDKRAKLVDALLEKPEFTDLRSLRLADLLRVNPRKFGAGNGLLGERSAALFYEWIWNSVNTNKPYDQFVRELVTARGSTYQNGPANFYRVERQANDRMENIGQAFLGVRMSCARCHKHPFDRWTTDDYWNFAAFTQKVSGRGGRLLDEEIVGYNPRAELRNASVTGRNRGKVAPATFLGDKQPAPDQPDMVTGLANWMTDPRNPFFARACVNRLWSYYFGRGIVHPVDDMRATTPESVPGLIDALAKELVDHKYDIKYMVRLILNSKTYQLSSVPNPSNQQDDRFFSHFMAKPMPAPVLLDMIDQACGVREQFGSFPERARAAQADLPVNNEFLSAFGQSHREFLTDIDPKLEPNLVQTLTMINSPYIENKVDNGTTTRAIAKDAKTDEDVVRECYARTFSRQPTPTELTTATALISKAKNRTEGTQDLLWALLTAREFYFNH